MIVLIGNGFDLHHGLKSSYWHYREWLRNAHPELAEKLNQYLDVSGDWWNDFEENLARFDIKKMIQTVPRVYPPRDPRFPPSFSSPVSGYFKTLREQITESFHEWVSTIKTDDVCGKIDIPVANLYVSFNYTDTLESVYGISEQQILYIHGKALRDEKLVFGHSQSQYEIERDYMQKHGIREIESFFDNGPVITDEEYQLTMDVSFLDKFPYTQIVRYSSILTPAIKNSTVVVCYGLSFSDVDFQYYEWIAEQNPELCWRVSWHTKEDKEKEESFFKRMGITKYFLFCF